MVLPHSFWIPGSHSVADTLPKSNIQAGPTALQGAPAFILKTYFKVITSVIQPNNIHVSLQLKANVLRTTTNQIRGGNRIDVKTHFLCHLVESLSEELCLREILEKAMTAFTIGPGLGHLSPMLTTRIL